MKIFALSATLILICIYVQSQNLVGYKPDEIRKYMKENYSEMNYNNVVNSQFSYLKYSDNSGNQTLLFFLNHDSVCKNERIICDINMKGQKAKEFNEKYTRTGENKWLDKRNGKEYIIEMNDGQWSCIVSIEPKK